MERAEHARKGSVEMVTRNARIVKTEAAAVNFPQENETVRATFRDAEIFHRTTRPRRQLGVRPSRRGERGRCDLLRHAQV